MSCEIIWNRLNLGEWAARYNTIGRSTLLQSYYYAQANAAVNSQKPRWGLIKINGVEAGLVQIFEAGLFGNLIHAVMCDRGPLWFSGFGNAIHTHAFLCEFSRQFPRRLGRKRRIILEYPTENLDLLGIDLIQNEHQYETIWLDLRKNEDDLRKALKKQWRGTLQKAEKAGLKIKWDTEGKFTNWLIYNYAADRAAKNYGGISIAMLRALIEYGLKSKSVIIGQAIKNDNPVAGILILTHGQGATYQVGFNNPDGREMGAHHLLLWESLSMLKERGVSDFDLGGINDESAKGVKTFKQAMGGEFLCLPYCFR